MKTQLTIVLRLVACLCMLVLVNSVTTPSRPVHASSPIQHIVFIMKENRTFDNYFGLFPGADGATTGKVKVNGVVKTVPLNALADIAVNFCHEWQCAHTAIDSGKMDAFNLASGSHCGSAPYACYTEASQSLIPNYWQYAQHYVLSDRTFSSEVGASFVNHLFTVAGTSVNTITNPKLASGQNTELWGCDALAGTYVQLYGTSKTAYPCLDGTNLPVTQTLADEMDAAGISWKFYSPSRLSSTKIEPGYEWHTLNAFPSERTSPNNVPWQQFVTDAQNNALPAFSWLNPPETYSEHAPFGTCVGENWTVQAVNAIMQSPAWSSTVIVLAWDDWGGFYDHLAPPVVDGLGLGIRVPLLIISPFTTPHVSHTVYEFASVLKLAEKAYGLPSLGQRDSTAGDMLADLDFTKSNPPLTLSQRTCSGKAVPMTGDFND